MLLSRLLLSNAVTAGAAAFAHASLELTKLHLLHKEALSNDPTGAGSHAQTIEETFRKELDTFRAVFTVSAHLPSAKLYAPKVLRALEHFGLTEDPLVRQVEKVLVREGLRGGPRRNLAFKGCMAPSSSAGRQSNSSSVLNATWDASEQLLPTELPSTPAVDEASHRSRVVKVPSRHRGHWVLRDPDIALTKEERRFDAW